MTLSAIVGAALVASLVTQAQPLWAKKVALEQRVLEAIGKDAVDCGVFAGNPIESARKLTKERDRAVSQCATESRVKKRAWFFAVKGSAIDSAVATGLMGWKDGRIQVFWYDSAPCGGPHCADSFKTYDCLAPAESTPIRLPMTCSDTTMPQPK